MIAGEVLRHAQQQAIAAIQAKGAGARCAWCGANAVDEIEVDIARGRDTQAYSDMACCSACGRVQP